MSKEVKSTQPREAQVMAAVLKDMGIMEYEPGVVNQMLEFTYKYISQVLDDARAYANYSKKGKAIEMDDVKLAIGMQVEKAFTTPPPRDLLLELARNRNANPLPPIKSQCGIRLPPDRYCLTASNFRLKSSCKKTARASRAKMENGTLKPNISMITTKSGNNQNVTLVQKPTTTVAATPPQKVVSVSRPVIKVTPGPPGLNSKLMTPELKLNIKQEEPDVSGKRKREEDEFD